PGASSRSRKTTRHSPLPGALLIPGACRALQDLRVAASLCLYGPWGVFWFAFQSCMNVLEFEVEHGVLNVRADYNDDCLERARRERVSVLGQHSGLYDLFVPVCVGDQVPAVIVAGPFATSRPTSTEILERWRRLTGRHDHPSDPEFAMYVDVSLSTLVLDKQQRGAFQRLLERMAALMASESSVEDVRNAIKSLGAELGEVRFVENVWGAARMLVDERTSRSWTRSELTEQREALGLKAIPDSVVVGLFVNRRRDSDPVDDLLRGDAFQRACVELARARGNALSGQIGSHGVTFLGASAGASARGRGRLLELSEEAARMARKQFGLALHVGVSTVSAALPAQYQAALAAAESALALDKSLVYAETEAPLTSTLGTLRQELARQIEENPNALPARFDVFLEMVATGSGYRLELARAHLEAGFERMTEAVLHSGTMDVKGLQSVREGLKRGAGEARTMNELFAAYRLATHDLVDGVKQPAAAHQDRSLRRAEEYVRQHYSEALTLDKVARVAGFAPNYFSRLFHERQKRTFVNYLTELRIARAKELLVSTSLTVQRIAELSGFSRAQYLSRLFKQSTSQTPLEYRRLTRAKEKSRGSRSA
ncbi:MAG TPA: AraC family transcriptional regulator, partial [Polyangiaceae bacterium]|nr:AraC family transcriptional regulator [Polyangiaceae bacterium]